MTAWKGFWLLTGESPGSSSYSGMLCFGVMVVVEEEEGAAGGGAWSASSIAKGSEGVLV